MLVNLVLTLDHTCEETNILMIMRGNPSVNWHHIFGGVTGILCFHLHSMSTWKSYEIIRALGGLWIVAFS